MTRNRQGPKGPKPKEPKPIVPRKPKIISKNKPSPSEANKIRIIADLPPEIEEEPVVPDPPTYPERFVRFLRGLCSRVLLRMVCSVADIVKMMLAVPACMLWIAYQWAEEMLVTWWVGKNKEEREAEKLAAEFEEKARLSAEAVEELKAMIEAEEAAEVEAAAEAVRAEQAAWEQVLEKDAEKEKRSAKNAEMRKIRKKEKKSELRLVAQEEKVEEEAQKEAASSMAGDEVQDNEDGVLWTVVENKKTKKTTAESVSERETMEEEDVGSTNATPFAPITIRLPQEHRFFANISTNIQPNPLQPECTSKSPLDPERGADRPLVKLPGYKSEEPSSGSDGGEATSPNTEPESFLLEEGTKETKKSVRTGKGQWADMEEDLDGFAEQLKEKEVEWKKAGKKTRT